MTHSILRRAAASSAVICAALLSGCGGEPAATDAMDTSSSSVVSMVSAPAAAQSPPAASASGNDWSGTYAGNTDGAEGEATITRDGQSNRYSVSVDVASREGCGGSVRGNATANGNALTLTAPVEDSGGESCRVTFARTGIGVSVTTDNCMSFHGMSCGFDGNYRRTSAPPPAPRATAPATTNARLFVGAWSSDGMDCEGDTTLTLNADGTLYDNNTSGRWSVAGNILTYTTLVHDVMESEGRPRPVRNPRPIRYTVVTLDQGNLAFRAPDGQMFEYVRCPSA